jgi:hypothetical protein
MGTAMKRSASLFGPTRWTRLAGLVVVLSAATIITPAGASVAAANAPARVRPADLGIVQAYVAGGARSAGLGQTLTFVWTAKNFGPGVADVSIDLVSVTGIDQFADTSSENCVLPDGSVINADTPSCEPGIFRAGQRAGSLVFTGVVDGTADIVLQACARDLSGARDPRASNNCRTLRVALA